MPIESLCQGCGARLQLPDSAAGRPAQCPQCQTTFVAGGSPVMGPLPTTIPVAAPSPAEGWTVTMADGQAYGPVSKMQLDAWVAEGRVTGDSQLTRVGQVGWLWARDVYPVLGGGFGPIAPNYSGYSAADFGGIEPNAAAAQTGFNGNPYSSPVATNPSDFLPGNRYWMPHRGGMLLTFGILGIVLQLFCLPFGFFGVASWIMGRSDLREMRAGFRDPAGQGLTQAGLILGIIGTVFLILHIAAVVFFIAVAIRH